jgi:sugar/nucleoside kinase (ribokinase family)
VKRLVCIGGAHVDRRGRVFSRFIPGASNPGAMREDAGGGGFNALRTAAAFGVEPLLVSVRGGDSAGEFVASAVADAGIAEATAVFLDRRTASYTAILDEHGDAVAALADMAIYDDCFARALRRKAAHEAVLAADAVLIDANLPAPAIAVALAVARVPVHAIAVSPAKVVRFAPFLQRLATLFMNRREMAALTGLPVNAGAPELTAALRSIGLQRGVVTDGPKTLIAFDSGADFFLEPPRMDRVADVTGAGDALAGAAVAALMRGEPFAEALRQGVAASHLKLSSEHAAERFPEETHRAALAGIPAPVPLARTEPP